MSDLLNAKRATSTTEEDIAKADDRAPHRSRRTRLAIFFAGLAAVVAVGVGVVADGDSDPTRAPEKPVTPFVTIDAPSTGGFSSADG